MNFLPEEIIECPYCGETMSVLIDPEDIDQTYIEDCQVCCKPIRFSVSNNNGECYVQVSDENEV